MICDGKAGNPFLMKRGKEASYRGEEWETGLLLSYVRTLRVPLSWKRVHQELLELPQGCQGPFRGSRGKVGFLSRSHIGKGPHLALRGESPGFSRVAAANFVSLTSYDEDFREALVGASGIFRLHASCERPLDIPLQSLPWPRSSSGVEAGNSVFLSYANMDFGVPLGFPQGIQASSHVETCKSALLSNWKSSVRLPVELT